MTVNISVQTDDISILCADSLTTIGARNFEGAKKLMVLDKEKYALAICDTGNGNTAQLVFDALKGTEADSLEDCVGCVLDSFKEEWGKIWRGEQESHMRRRYEELSLREVKPDSQFGEYICKGIEQHFYNTLQNNTTAFLIQAIDKESGSRVINLITPEGVQKMATPSQCLGSGQEGASQYLNKVIPCKEVQLSEEELLYHVLAAYAPSTEYAGVGGIPLFAICSGGTITAYDDTKGCISANLVNASIAGILPKEKVISALGKIVSKKPIGPVLNKLIEEYGDQLGVTADGLSTIPIPARAWEYRAKTLNK